MSNLSEFRENVQANNARAQLEVLRQELSSVGSELTESTVTRDKLRRDIEAASTYLMQLEDLQSKINKEITTAQEELKRKEDALDRREAAFTEQMTKDKSLLDIAKAALNEEKQNHDTTLHETKERIAEQKAILKGQEVVIQTKDGKIKEQTDILDKQAKSIAQNEERLATQKEEFDLRFIQNKKDINAQVAGLSRLADAVAAEAAKLGRPHELLAEREAAVTRRENDLAIWQNRIQNDISKTRPNQKVIV